MNTDDQDYQALQRIFLEALELRAPAERAAYLDRACEGDSSRRQAIEALLKEYEAGGESVRSSSTNDYENRDAPMFVPGKVLVNRYRIVSLLGKGGMGEVYRADDLKLDQPVALKFLPAALAHDERLLKALYNEVRLARRVTHRHVGRVYDIGEAEGLHFLSMEYIEGEDLGALLKQIGRLPGDKAISLAQQLCAGLQAAHDEGLLHLDLKPGNLMIDQRGDLRVTDFGLARMTSDAELEKRRSGTPAYMAPEQLLHGEATERSDLYAVGLILYEMFTGKRMNHGRTNEEMIAWHRAAADDLSKQLGPVQHLNANVRELILTCLASDPFKRPESVSEILAMLEKVAPDSASSSLPEAPAISIDDLKESDVFISYALIDDHPLSAKKQGWVTQFQRNLEVRVEQLTGRDIKVWSDPRRRLASEPDEQMLALLPQAKTMVSVLSPPFVQTSACRREMEAFWDSAEREGRLRIGGKPRLFKVVKTPVDSLEQSPEMHHRLSQLLGFDFFEIDPETGRLREYAEFVGPIGEQRFHERVYDLAQEVSGVLKALERGEHSPAGQGKTIYLAETTSDFSSERDQIRRELIGRGHTVLPDQPLPLVLTELQRVVRGYLEQCDFSIHPIGTNYGIIPEGAKDSLVAIQNQIAAEHCLSSTLLRVLWMPKHLAPADPRQTRLIELIKSDGEHHRGAEIVVNTVEVLKSVVLEKLTALSKQEPSLTATEAGPPRIYIICDRADEKAVEELEDYLFDQGFEVSTPHFEGDEAEVCAMHRQNLVHCDASLIYYGAGSKGWVETKLMDVLQAPGYGRTKPIQKKLVFVAPPLDRHKERFRTHVAEVLQSTDAWEPALLSPFVENLKSELA